MVRTSTRVATLLLPAVLAVPALVPAPAAAQTAGVVIELTSIDHRESPARTDISRLQIADGNVAMAVEGESTGTMIFRGNDRTMIAIDHERRSYIEIDEETLSALAAQMNAAMAQMQQMLENMPAEQRAMMERMMDQGGIPGMEMPGMADLPEIDVRDTGRTESQGGYSTRVFEVFEDGELARRVWMAPWDEVEGGAEARDAMAGMVEFFDSFLESLPQMSGNDSMMRNPFRYLDLDQGMPILTHELAEDGSIEQESSVSSVAREQIEGGTFAPPEGYSRQELPGG
jgi:hypothetical protein